MKTRMVDMLLSLLKKDNKGMGVTVKRCRNRITPYKDAASHPYPGTFPSVGGWRLPSHLFDADPETAEVQANIIAKALTEAGFSDEWYWKHMNINGIIVDSKDNPHEVPDPEETKE